jgi:hypothetical protein
MTLSKRWRSKGFRGSESRMVSPKIMKLPIKSSRMKLMRMKVLISSRECSKIGESGSTRQRR